MPTEKIKIADDEHEIEVKPITMIFHNGDLPAEIEYPERFAITPEMTIYHADRVQKLHEEFPTFWREVHVQRRLDKEPQCGPIPDEIRKLGMGHRHLMGLFDLSLKLTDQGVPLVWKYPETYLHPSFQAALADVVILLADYANRPDPLNVSTDDDDDLDHLL